MFQHYKINKMYCNKKMFFVNTARRSMKENKIVNVFQSSYEIKRNFKINKQRVRLVFPKQRLALEFGDYDDTNKRILDIEKSGLRVFNIPYKEDIFTVCGRLLYVLKSIDESTNK